MNLDLDEGEVDASVELEEEESECLKRLEKSLSQCAKCGVEKRCKIDKLGTHVHLLFQQLRSWAFVVNIPIYSPFSSFIIYSLNYFPDIFLIYLFKACYLEVTDIFLHFSH